MLAAIDTLRWTAIKLVDSLSESSLDCVSKEEKGTLPSLIDLTVFVDVKPGSTVSVISLSSAQRIFRNTQRGGDVVQWVEHRTGTLPTQVRFPGAAKDFSPRVNFQCRLSYDVCMPLCAIAWINICAHIKDPVVHVRVWWIMETLNTQHAL